MTWSRRREELLAVEPGHLRRGPFIEVSVSDLPDVGIPALVGYQEQADWAITVIIDRRQRGDLFDLLA